MAKTRKRKGHEKRAAARRLELEHARHRQMKQYHQQIEMLKDARLKELLGNQDVLSDLPEGVTTQPATEAEALSELELLQVLDTVDPDQVKSDTITDVEVKD